jgi:hypothetical protein
MIEAELVARFVWDRLAADGGVGGVSTLVGGRIFRDRVEQGAALPAVTISVVSSPDQLTANGDHVWQDVQIDVAARGEGESYAEVYPIAARIFTVLQGAGGTQSGVYLPKLRRVESSHFTNSTSGKPFVHIVQTFFTEAQPA